MANPAPTINQINAFNATQGTTIDFNIIGGTELVRSNRIYIYDLSDNSLICTHLYVSTESIHELPANTDSSIVYESGKSSADFVNGAQYYAQIQTYTDTAGTEGGSGLSVAKMFWCLVDPTLTITAIPSTISTTSYNVSATYNANTSVVSNIIQQYQFSLYSATGSLLQSSGVVVGSGTQQGTSTAYDISYNFSGLSVGSSYYVVIDVTTTQGMSVSAQSSTFTVSIDTPTLGEATVVNNACDGYISVTSNLSSEYGGSGSGEIATFETDSVNDVSSLKVTLTPQQSDTPWIGTDHDTTPYLHRAMPTQSNDYNRESGVIVGGTVGWNQLMEHGNFDVTTGWSGAGYGTVTVANNIGSLTLSEVSGSARIERAFVPTVGHKTLVTMDIKTPYATGVFSTFQAGGYNTQIARASLSADTWATIVGIRNVEQNDTTSGKIRFYVGDTTASVGDVVQFRNGMIIDLTAYFGTTIADYIYSLEQATPGAGVAWFRKYFPEDYYPYSANTLQSVQATAHKTYDGGGNVLGNYALDSSLTLRGIPKLDNGNLYYDGDTYESDGSVTRKWGFYTIQTSDITLDDGGGYTNVVCAKIQNLPSMLKTNTKQAIHSKYGVAQVVWPFDETSNIGKFANNPATQAYWFIFPVGTTIEQMRTALVGTTLVYELATPTTETAQAYTNPQIVDPDGTEEYVTANSVPVGHDSTYSLVCPISGYDEVEAWHAGCAVTDNSTDFIELPYPIENGETYGFSTLYPSAGDSHVMFYDENKTYVDWWTTTSHYPNESQKTNTYNKTIKYIKLHPTSDSYTKTHYVGVRNISKGEEYNFSTYTAQLPETVYGGTVDLVSGEMVVDRAITTFDGSADEGWSVGTNSTHYRGYTYALSDIKPHSLNEQPTSAICDKIKTGTWHNAFGGVLALGQTGKAIGFGLDSLGITNYTDLNVWLSNNPITICYELATPQTYQLTSQEIQTLVGTNNVWSDAGDVEITYNIPITNLLVKRQDVADVSGMWLTLYSQPITQASDMDFTFIDFTNQYGKTYKYALVPLLTQTQSGVEVEVEGGYTVSDEVQSIFDGVFIADSTGSQKCKANVGYGNVDMNQVVGSITPIGAKYPVVITNSQNQYHNGSISGTIVPDDYYFNGNLSRIDMVNKRNELERFLTNKRAKIIKDWNSNIWLVMITDNIGCNFNNNYGMGMVNFNANWVEVGDPTNQQDLQATGLINIGGV